MKGVFNYFALKFNFIKQINKEITIERFKFFKFTGYCMIAFLLSTYILTLMGIIDFRVGNEIELSILTTKFLDTILFAINMFFILSISLRIFDKRIFKYLLLFMLIFIPIDLFVKSGLITSYFIPMIFVFMCSIKSKFKNYIEIILCFVIFPFIQISLGFIKLEFFKINYNSLNSFTMFIVSIDLYLVYLYFYVGVKKYVRLVLGMARGDGFDRKFCTLSKGNSFQLDRQTREKIDLAEFTPKQKLKFLLIFFGVQAIQIIVVLLIGSLNNRLIELSLILPIFWISREILKYSWHSEKMSICFISALFGFYILSSFTLPISISIFTTIFSASLLTYYMYCLGKLEIEINNN